MLTSVNPAVERDCVLRVSREELFCDEAGFEGAIPTSQVKEVRLEQRRLNPLVLVVPLIAGGIAGGVFWLFSIKPPSEEKMWLVIVPLFLAGYAIHAVWYFISARRHIVQIIAPSLQEAPIEFYVTESSFDAALLLDEIQSALNDKKG